MPAPKRYTANVQDRALRADPGVCGGSDPYWESTYSLTREDAARAVAEFPRIAADRSVGHAAVCLLLVAGEDGEPSFVLTRRAATVRAHRGQWAIPGGRIDPGENVEEAALRELREELGVDLEPARVLGELDDFVTRSGYCITPVVAWAVDLPFEPVPSADEVASVHVFGLSKIDVEPILLSIPESTRPVIQLPIDEWRIHAPTGAVLYQFAEVLLHERATRVAHFEQPTFAWK